MAEKELTQPGRMGLPEPDTFTLGEIAERWSGLTGQTVTPRHIVNYRNQGLVDLFDVRPPTPPGLSPFASLAEVAGHYNQHGWPSPPSEQDLRMTIEERDRFEQECRIGAYAGTMPDPSKPERLDPRKETTYLQLIRLMAAGLGLPDAPYKAAVMLQEMAATHGLSAPAKADTIATALKAAGDLDK